MRLGGAAGYPASRRRPEYATVRRRLLKHDLVVHKAEWNSGFPAMQCLIVAAFLMTPLLADSPGKIESRYSSREFPLTADPAARQWKKVKPVLAENDRYGKPVARHRTEIRSRWTKDNL